MKKLTLTLFVFYILFSFCSCGGEEPENQPEQDALSQYITYDLPETLVNGSDSRDLGYLGGKLFCYKDTGNCVAKKASDSTPYGWNSYGGVEIYYNLNCKFSNGQLTDVSLPWNHSDYLTKAKPVDQCEEPAVLLQVEHDLYTAPEARENNITTEESVSTMWYVFFANENSNICYAVFLNSDYYNEEDIISLAQTVQFKEGAFNIKVK